MRRFAWTVALVLAGMLAGAAAQAAPGEKPNIVIVLADDLGHGDLGCYNAASKVPTPNMDRIAAAGMRFNDAHTPSSVCTPTRYGVLTGRYAWRSRLKSGVLWGYSTSLIEDGRLTLPAMLKAQGYRTGGIGKWHLGFQEYDPGKPEREQKVDYDRPLRPGPMTLGFDSYFGIPASLDMDPYLFVVGDHPERQPTETIEASGQVRQGGKGFWRAGPIAPGFRHIDVLPRLTEQAETFLDEHAEKAKSGDEPFFLYLALSAPHTPWLPTEPFRGKSEAGAYGDFVTMVDATVGRVLDALDRAGVADNTLLILTSDNGAHWTPQDKAKYGHLANGQRRGQKADIWEGGHRVPFLVRWPGRVEPGTTSDQTLCLTDLFATCAAVVGADVPDAAAEDSFNMLPAFLGQAEDPIRPAIVHHSSQGMFAIRQGDWKLCEGLGSGGFSNPQHIEPAPGGPKGQLYNLKDDPMESQNLYSGHPEVVARLTSLLDRYREEGRSRPGR